MKHLQVFTFETNRVRTIIRDGEPWFVARDVCEVLDLDNVSMAISRLDEDEVSSTEVIDAMGRTQTAHTVNEPGLYSLILGSRKPEARAFKRWVTHEVLPQIRRTGVYAGDKPQSPAELLLVMAQQVVDQEKRMNYVEVQLEEARHRINDLDRIDIAGDEQQHLNKLLRKYAFQNGLTFTKAWRDFTDRFNTAYRVNLTARIENYKEKYRMKELSRPQYLALTGQLHDAIRVADKMLNQTTAVGV